jgi:hypothetical protein
MAAPADDFDPNDMLQGWPPQPVGGAAPADMTRVLDGWLPPGVATAPTRRADDGVTDLPHIDLPPAGPRPAAEDVDYTEAPVVVRRYVNPRLLAQWQPGVWTGAVKQVCAETTEFLQTAHGPVVETYAPQMLLALWPPQNLSAPMLSRWPMHVMLCTAEAGRATDALLPLMPPAAMLWLTLDHVDWALMAELVLHHDAGLRPLQITALRSFVEAQREATFTRLNNAYRQPMPGQAVAKCADD